MPYDEALADRVRQALAAEAAAADATTAEAGADEAPKAAEDAEDGDAGAGKTGTAGIVEKEVVGGGLGFLKDGVMVVGVDATGLFVRVGKAGYEEAVAEPHARPKLVGTRATKGFVSIDPRGTATDADLRRWVARGLSYAATQPKKA